MDEEHVQCSECKEGIHVYDEWVYWIRVKKEIKYLCERCVKKRSTKDPYEYYHDLEMGR